MKNLSSGILRRVTVVRTDVLEKRNVVSVSSQHASLASSC
jgi:hypothetical protein